MTINIPSVQPGDLIRADYFNAIVSKLQEIEAKLAQLQVGSGPSGAVAIDSVTPSNPKVGQDIRIAGRNFGFSTGASRIDFDGIPPNFIRSGSSDTLLICDVPAIPGLPAAGGLVTLTVRNQFSLDTRPLTVIPAPVPVSGAVDLSLEAGDPDPVASGVDNFFTMRLFSRASRGVTLSLSAQTSPSFPVQILNAQRQPLVPTQIQIEPQQTRLFVVKVTIPSGTSGTPFTLAVTGTGEVTSNSSDSLVVGQSATPDTTFTLAPSGSQPDTASDGTKILTGTTIRAPASLPFVQINNNAAFTTGGVYEVRLDPVGTISGWEMALTDPAPDSTGRHVLNVTSGGVQRSIQFRVKPANSNSAQRQITLSVQRQGASKRRVITFTMIAK